MSKFETKEHKGNKIIIKGYNAKVVSDDNFKEGYNAKIPKKKK